MYMYLYQTKRRELRIKGHMSAVKGGRRKCQIRIRVSLAWLSLTILVCNMTSRGRLPFTSILLPKPTLMQTEPRALVKLNVLDCAHCSLRRFFPPDQATTLEYRSRVRFMSAADIAYVPPCDEFGCKGREPSSKGGGDFPIASVCQTAAC